MCGQEVGTSRWEVGCQVRAWAWLWERAPFWPQRPRRGPRGARSATQVDPPCRSCAKQQPPGGSCATPHCCNMLAHCAARQLVRGESGGIVTWGTLRATSGAAPLRATLPGVLPGMRRRTPDVAMIESGMHATSTARRKSRFGHHNHRQTRNRRLRLAASGFEHHAIARHAARRLARGA